MDFIDRYPIFSTTGFFSSFVIQDLKPLFIMVLAFILDYVLKQLKRKLKK